MPACECGVVAWCNSVLVTCALALVCGLLSFVVQLALSLGGADCGLCPECAGCSECPTCAAAARGGGDGDGGEGVCNTTQHPQYAAPCETTDNTFLLEMLNSLVTLVFFILLPLFIRRFKPRLGAPLVKRLLIYWGLLAIPAILNTIAEFVMSYNMRMLRLLKPLRYVVLALIMYHVRRMKQQAVREANGDESLLQNERYSLWREVTPAGRTGQFTVGRSGVADGAEALTVAPPPP